MRRHGVSLATLAMVLTPAIAPAQRLGKNVELFGTVAAVAGVTPAKTESGAHLDPHAGFRFDGGLQFSRAGLGVGLRVWQMAPTDEFGGAGFDVFMVGEWQVDESRRTLIRATAGVGFDDFDSGRGPDRPSLWTDGPTWSIGASRELHAPSAARIILSADLLVPTPTPGAVGRRRPVLEFGVGYRLRHFQPIGPLGSTHPR